MKLEEMDALTLDYLAKLKNLAATKASQEEYFKLAKEMLGDASTRADNKFELFAIIGFSFVALMGSYSDKTQLDWIDFCDAMALASTTAASKSISTEAKIDNQVIESKKDLN